MRNQVLILFIFFSALKAQEPSSHVFSLKPALGINGCQIHGDSYSGYNKFGVFVGTAVNARLGERMSVELGFYFSQKGAKHNQNPKDVNDTRYILTLNYFDFPLSLRYMLNKKYFATIGPSVAYLINYNENINYTNTTGTSVFNKFEVGVNIGLGRKLSDRFSLELRCSNSIMPIQNYGISSTVYYSNAIARFFDEGLYNNILTLFLAYHIDLNKNSK